MTGHALEPVPEVEDFIMEIFIDVGGSVTVIFIGFLCVRFSPGKLDLRGVVDDDITTGADVERAQAVDKELCSQR